MRRISTTLAVLAAIALAAGCDREEEPQTTCETHEDCTEEGAGFCDTDADACVACLEDTHCDGEATCVAGACEEPVNECDHEGLAAAIQQGFYSVTQDGPVVGYVGDTGDTPPVDRLRISWWFDYGADWNGPGVYPVESGSNLQDCGLCIEIYRFGADGSLASLFLATEGEVEVTEAGADGEGFRGALRGARFVEWDPDTDTAVNGGQVWCIPEHTWSTVMDGQLPCEDDDGCPHGRYCDTGTQECVACLDDDHCGSADAPFCNTDTNVCVACVSDDPCTADGQVCNLPTNTCVDCTTNDHCTGENEVCGGNACVDVSTCDVEGFAPENQSAANIDFFGSRFLFYRATDADENVLRVDLYGDAQPAPTFEPGTTIIGAHPNDQNFQTCSTCVLILANCDEDGEDCETYFAFAGELEVDELGTEDGENFAGTLRDVYFQEVTIDEDSRSTPVEGGGIWCLQEMAFSSYLNVDCLDETDCDGGLFCSDAGACVECLEDTHCEEPGELCLSNLCRVPPEGDTCEDAIVVDASGTFTGDMVGYTDAFAPGTNATSCTGYDAQGPDVVFAVTLEAGQTLEVTYTLASADGSVYIVSECLDGEPPVDHAGVCLAGADDTLGGQPEVVEYTNEGAEAQTVYVILDAYRPPGSPEAATWEAVFSVSP